MPAICRRVAVLVVALLCWSAGSAQPSAQSEPQAPTPSEQRPPQPTQQKDFEYIPFDQLPPAQQIPAPRLLISAYVFVILVLFLYVVSVARRLTAVQREVERLEAGVKRAG